MTAEIIEGPTPLEAVPEPEQEVVDGQSQEPPCTIYTENGAFVVVMRDAWGMRGDFVFATGAWAPSAEQIDVLIPYDRVQYIDLDFSYLEAVPAPDATTD